MLDILTRALIQLKTALDKDDIPILIGGGMGLYLRDTFQKIHRHQRIHTIRISEPHMIFEE